MGWYDAMYGRTGHGVDPGAPEKKGFARFAEILARDFRGLLGCNALCCILGLVPALAISLGSTLLSFWLAALLGLLSGLLIGPLMMLLCRCILHSLQNDATPWLSSAFSDIKSNYRRIAPLGMLCGLFGSLLLLLWNFMFTLADESGYYPGIAVLAFLLFDFYAFTVVFLMAFSLLPLSQQTPGALMLQGLRLAVRNPVRCLGGALVLLLYAAAVLALFPLSLFWMILAGFWLPGLILGLILYPVLQKEFDLKNLRCAPVDSTDSDPAELTPKEKKRRSRANWWGYHWGMVATGVLVALCVAYVAYSLATIVDPDYSVAVVTADALPDAALTSLETSLEALADDKNGDGKVYVSVNNYTWSSSESVADMNAQMAGATRLNTDLSNGESAIWLIEDPTSLDAAYSALTDCYGSGWQEHVMLWREVPVLESLSLGSYPIDTAGTTAEIAPLYENLTLALLGDDNSLWQAITEK